MTKTIVGRLIIQLTQKGAKETASQVQSSLTSIEQRARQLGNGPAWGTRFQRQLDTLKLSPRQLAAVQASWDRLPTAIGKRLERSDVVGRWKTGVLSHFADIESRGKTFSKRLGRILSGTGTQFVLGYGAYAIGRNAAVTGAERDRAYLRLDQAGIPKEDQERYAAEAERLTGKYPGMSMTEILELALRTQSTMGSTDRTLAILEALVKGQIALMSARGPDTATNTLDRITKAGDVLGQNAEGQEGIDNMIALIDGLVRASQIEGLDFDPGSVLDFARRAKLAGAGWSTEFIAAIGPAIIQDSGGPQAGNALAMAFKSFVLGDNSMNGKVYKARQAELGLRESPDGDLIGSELFTVNPFAWSQEYLLPALEKAGVDVDDDGAVTRAVGKLSGNSNATAQLTRFITQREQYLKSINAYLRALGIDGANMVVERDPFVAWEGFKNSFANFTGAIAENVEIITPGLNAISSSINRFAASVRENPLKFLGLGGMAVGAAAIGSWKVFSGIWALAVAGPSLQTAAMMLQGAAGSIQGGGSGAVGAAGNSRGGGPGLLRWGMSAWNVLGNAQDIDAAKNMLASENGFKAWKARIVENDAAANEWLASNVPGMQLYEDTKNWVHDWFGGSADSVPADDLPDPMSYMPPGGIGGYEKAPAGAPPSGGMVGEQAAADMERLASSASSADAILNSLSNTLNGINPLVSPQVDTKSIEKALQLVQSLSTALQSLGGLSARQGAAVRQKIDGLYADYGITP